MRSRNRGKNRYDIVIWLLFAVIAILVLLAFLSIRLEGGSTDRHLTKPDHPTMKEPHAQKDVQLVQKLTQVGHEHRDGG